MSISRPASRPAGLGSNQQQHMCAHWERLLTYHRYPCHLHLLYILILVQANTVQISCHAGCPHWNPRTLEREMYRTMIYVFCKPVQRAANHDMGKIRTFLPSSFVHELTAKSSRSPNNSFSASGCIAGYRSCSYIDTIYFKTLEYLHVLQVKSRGL